MCYGCQDRRDIGSLLQRGIVSISQESGALEDRVTEQTCCGNEGQGLLQRVVSKQPQSHQGSGRSCVCSDWERGPLAA